MFVCDYMCVGDRDYLQTGKGVGGRKGLCLAWCNAMCQTQWSAIICGRSLSTEGYPAYIDTLHTQTCCDPLRQGPDCLWLNLSNWMCQTRFHKSLPTAELCIWFMLGCYRLQSNIMPICSLLFHENDDKLGIIKFKGKPVIVAQCVPVTDLW